MVVLLSSVKFSWTIQKKIKNYGCTDPNILFKYLAINKDFVSISTQIIVLILILLQANAVSKLQLILRTSSNSLSWNEHMDTSIEFWN